MKMKSHLSIIVFLVSIGINFLRCGGGTETYGSYIGGGGGGTETIGTVVDPQGNPAKGATVELFFADSLISYRTTITDSKGNFSFDIIPSGLYTIICKSLDGKMAFIAPFDYDSSKGLKLDTTTVLPPGSIEGCVKYPFIENQPDHDILVFIPGTSYTAIADDNGAFSITNIPQGVYTLKISKINYSVKKISNVIVTSNKVTAIDSCVSLEIDTLGKPFAPKVREIIYNELEGTVTINWNSIPSSDLEGYFVYRGTLDNRPKISTVIKDTFFTDTVYKNFLTDTNPHTFSYFVKSVDKSNESDFSDPLNISVYPPVFYRCKFTPIVKNTSGNDTVTNADTAVITVIFVNRKREPKEFIWNIDNDEVKHSISAEFSDSAYRGSDTIKYRWKTPGEKKIYIKSIDDKADTLVDSLEIEIYDSLSFHPTGKWIACRPMTNGRKFACAAELDSVIYCIGGITYNSKNGMSTFSNTVEKYDIRTGKWTNGPAMPQKIYWASSVSLNGKIYVIGGENEAGEKLSSIYTYDTISGWVLNGNLPYGISGTSSCVYDNTILITGGEIVDSVDLTVTNSNEILRYDPMTRKTDTLATIDGDNRIHHQAVISEHHLYLISGTNLENVNLSSMLVFDLKANKVCDTITVSRPSCFFSAWVDKGRLYLAGGANSPILNTALIYDTFEYLDLNSSNKDWIPLQRLSGPVFSGASVTVKGALYIVGGAKGNSSGQEINFLNVYYP